MGMSYVKQHIDFTRIKASHRLQLVLQLAQSCKYARHVRSISVRIALGTSATATLDTSAQQDLLDCNDALSITQTVQLLDALPHLTSLRIGFINAQPGTYISRLPVALKSALARHAYNLKQLHISSAQLVSIISTDATQMPTSDSYSSEEEEEERQRALQALAIPFFHLDERLMADLIYILPHLRVLAIPQVCNDTLASISPLFEVVSSLEYLKRLDILDPDSFGAQWSLQPLSGPLEHLKIVSSSKVLSDSMYTFFHLHRRTLKHLNLVYTSDTVQESSNNLFSSSQRKVSLPELQSLRIESEMTDEELLETLEQFIDCTKLERLSVRSASVYLPDVWR